MKTLIVGELTSSEKNGHSLNGNGNGNGSSANGSRHIRKGSVLRLLCDDGRWENGTVEQVLLSRCKGILHHEFEIRLQSGYRTWAQAENLAPVITRPLSFLERLEKIAHSCDREQNGNGHSSQHS
jgi:hypothetical protein